MIIRITYHNTTHAPLYKRFKNPTEGHVAVGEDGMYGPVDPETGAEYKAFGGRDHKYNRDYEVGASYPQCGFFTVKGIDGRDYIELSHDESKEILEALGLFEDCLEPVLVPDQPDYGSGWTWYHGFQFTPVERSPRVQRMEDMFDRRAEGIVTASGSTVTMDVNDPRDDVEEVTA